MWQLQSSFGEMILRATVVYGVVFLLFRLIGKKQLGEFSPFDFVLLLIVSESVSNGLSGGDESLTGAVISVTTLLVLSRLIETIAFKSRKFEKFVDGESKIIVEDGKVSQKVLNQEMITTEELMGALRQHEVENLNELKFAILETNGKITVIKKQKS